MANNRAEKYMRIDDIGPSKSGLTRRWQVTSIGAVGFIKWSGAWRRYIFEPLDGTFFDDDGLTMIADFLKKENGKKRRNRDIHTSVVLDE